jgi:hypothetical protein
MQKDDWQLEVLCNIAAAELLMPIGSFPDLQKSALSIDKLMVLRKEFDVSTEAIVLRFARLTDHSCFVFCASRREDGPLEDRYVVDYMVPSRSWTGKLLSGAVLPETSIVRECTAIGFTAKANEPWPGQAGTFHVEAVGIPPFPGHRFPRVVGLATLQAAERAPRPHILILKGDALQPRGDGFRIIAHVVNDRAAKWGAGFALAVRRRFPQAQDAFIEWTAEHTWEHEVIFEGCPKADPGRQYPSCLEGERACPPEDVGGVEGYAGFLKTIQNKNHEERAETLEWGGGWFDPEEFDPATATKSMKKGLPDWRSEPWV